MDHMLPDSYCCPLVRIDKGRSSDPYQLDEKPTTGRDKVYTFTPTYPTRHASIPLGLA